MTDMKKLKEGIISATLALQDILDAEAGEDIHFLTKKEYEIIDEMTGFLCDIYKRTLK